MGTPNSERVKFTKLTPETVKKLEEVFAIDGTVEEACFYADITRQTYYNWVKDDPKMYERFDRLRQRPVLKARQEIVKGLSDNPEFSLKYLERKRKAEWSPRSEVTGAEGKDLVPENVTALDKIALALDEKNKEDYEVDSQTKGIHSK